MPDLCESASTESDDECRSRNDERSPKSQCRGLSSFLGTVTRPLEIRERVVALAVGSRQTSSWCFGQSVLKSFGLRSPTFLRHSDFGIRHCPASSAAPRVSRSLYPIGRTERIVKSCLLRLFSQLRNRHRPKHQDNRRRRYDPYILTWEVHRRCASTTSRVRSRCPPPGRLSAGCWSNQ